jgi:hypothetical protein
MWSRVIVIFDPRVQIGLQLVGRTIYLFAERNTIELAGAAEQVAAGGYVLTRDLSPGISSRYWARRAFAFSRPVCNDCEAER